MGADGQRERKTQIMNMFDLFDSVTKIVSVPTVTPITRQTTERRLPENKRYRLLHRFVSAKDHM
jgi:hypothetical protein